MVRIQQFAAEFCIFIFQMMPHQKKRLAFTITNVGKIGFYFKWVLKEQEEEFSEEKFRIGFKEQEGYVMSNSEAISTVTITPLRTVLLNKLRVKLQVSFYL